MALPYNYQKKSHEKRRIRFHALCLCQRALSGTMKRLKLAAGNPAKRTKVLPRQRIYDKLATMPEGFVTTYGRLAKALVPPSCARAVGQAMKNSPPGTA